MENNETVRRLRWALSIDDADAARMTRAGGVDASAADAAAWRAREEDPARVECSDPALGALLAGLVLERRGPRQRPDEVPAPSARPPATAAPAGGGGSARVDNNAVMKAVRIALELRSDEVAGFVGLSVAETASLFRRPGTRNYRRCGDQVLRRFFAAVAARERPDVPVPPDGAEMPEDGAASEGATPPDAAAEAAIARTARAARAARADPRDSGDSGDVVAAGER